MPPKLPGDILLEKPILKALHQIDLLRTELNVLKEDLGSLRVRLNAYESKQDTLEIDPAKEEIISGKGWFF